MKSVEKLNAIDFFAGSGLVTEGLSESFDVVWANDNCPRKKAVYTQNFGTEHFVDVSITEVHGRDLPEAELCWASFPCQDLSLAGNMTGIETGDRSALFWEWIRILDEMEPENRPPVLCIENVVGFLVAQGGSQFRLAYEALKDRGYVAGAFVLDVRHFTPQSRPRSFIVATHEDVSIDGLTSVSPLDHVHTSSVMRAFAAVDDRDWVWWKLPELPIRKQDFTNICERDAPCDSAEKTAYNLSLLSEGHRLRLEEAMASGRFLAGTGYKRVRRSKDGERRQFLELRFDGLAGCLRTPRGGSSRQFVVIVDKGDVKTRLLTIREAARLMGVRDNYWFPPKYNDAYLALGDAVAVPVTRFLSQNLLRPLSARARSLSTEAASV